MGENSALQRALEEAQATIAAQALRIHQLDQEAQRRSGVEALREILALLDKAGAASFGLDDMELLALFARPASVAVEQARLVRGTGRLLVAELARRAHGRGEDELARDAQSVLAAGGASQSQEQTLEL